MAGPGRVPRCLALIAVLTGMLISGALPAAAAETPTPASVVATDLGANKIPAALVILVDTSSSMAPPTGLYPQVYQQLRTFLAALAKQDPQDEVAVVQFASKAATHTIYAMGPPTPDIPLQQNPTFTVGTDIGYAFQLGLEDLSQDKNAQVGGVMLLSDGGMWEPSDLLYDGGKGYSAPGWAQLRHLVQGLGIPVTGYGLPLTTDQGDISALDTALNACFGSQQLTLTSGFDNLSDEFDTAQQKILNSRVAVAAAPDSGRGVRVTWGGAAAGNGTIQLNPASDHANLTVTLTATTGRIPLEVIGASIDITDFPEQVSGISLPSDIALRPGQSVTVPLRLTWKPMPGTAPWSGTIDLNASVKSPDTNAIRNFYQDASFTTGALTGNVSTSYSASAPAPSYTAAAILFLLVLVLLAAGAVVYLGARLSGSLTLRIAGGGRQQETLPRRPRYTFTVTGPAALSGGITVWRMPFSKDMRIKHTRFPQTSFTLPRGGRVMVAGIEINHYAGYPDDSRINA